MEVGKLLIRMDKKIRRLEVHKKVHVQEVDTTVHVLAAVVVQCT